MGQMAGTLELKPLLYNNGDPGKKFDTLGTEIALAATKIIKFCTKKAYLSTGTLNAPNELCFGMSAFYQ